MFIINDKIAIPWEEFSVSYARSAGPGGQNVNKRETKVILEWAVASSPSLPQDVRERFLKRYAARLTQEGHVLVSSDELRSQGGNLRACYEKLFDMLLAVAQAPKKRVATKPSKSAKQKRLTGKRLHSDTKKNRQKVKEY